MVNPQLRTSTTMQECHDNDEIESHNHNEYPLLYKEAEISMSRLGKFLECWKCYIIITYNMCTRDLPDMYALRLRAYISGKSLMPMLQLLHTYLHNLRQKYIQNIHTVCSPYFDYL